MIAKSEIEKCVNAHLKPDQFLVEVKVSTDNKIKVVLDSDTSISISDCVDITRLIEKQFNREEEDYELEVTSFGLGQELLLERQVKKRIGKEIAIQLNDGEKVKGVLHQLTENELIVILNLSKKQLKEGQIPERKIARNQVKKIKDIISF